MTQVAMITGASWGIGAATAALAAKRGYAFASFVEVAGGR